MHEYGDFLACGISSQIHQEVHGFDEILEPNAQNRLKQTSIIRLGFLAITTQNQIRGRLGSISENLHKDLLHRLADYLVL
jgi:mRNA interferase MazF